MTIELNNYGFTLDSSLCYVALSWQLLIAASLLLISFKIIKRIKGNK